MAGIMQPRTHFLAQACRVVARVEYGVTAKAGVTIICLIVSQNRINTLIIIPCDFVAISFPYEASMALLETFPTQPNRHFFWSEIVQYKKMSRIDSRPGSYPFSPICFIHFLPLLPKRRRHILSFEFPIM